MIKSYGALLRCLPSVASMVRSVEGNRDLIQVTNPETSNAILTGFKA